MSADEHGADFDTFDHLMRQRPGDVGRGGGWQIRVDGHWTSDRAAIVLTFGRLHAAKRAERAARRQARKDAA